MESISVIGAGTWGGTIAQALAQKGHPVTVWHKFPNEIEFMQTNRKHFILDRLVFDENIQFSDDFGKIVPAGDIIIIAVPSHIVRLILPEITPLVKADALMVNLAKGIENDSLMTMSQVIHEVGGFAPERIVTVYGPSHAEEVAIQLPTTLVSASISKIASRRVQTIFASPYIRVYTNQDIIGVELGGSLKNVIAIAAGICDGIGYGDNTKAALLTRGITEMTRLGVAMGAKRETFFGLSGIGDLIATCLSQHSRNRFVGEAIGRGQSLDEVLSKMTMVAEGVKTAKSVHQLINKYGVNMPISEAIYTVLFMGQNPVKAVHKLMTRELKSEH